MTHMEAMALYACKPLQVCLRTQQDVGSCLWYETASYATWLLINQSKDPVVLPMFSNSNAFHTVKRVTRLPPLCFLCWVHT